MATEADKEAQEKLATNEVSDFAEALIGQDVDADYLAEKAKAELEACETKTYLGKLSDTVIYSKPLIAWDIRQKGRQDIHKLRGDYPSEKVEHTVTLEDKLRAIHKKRDKED